MHARARADGGGEVEALDWRWLRSFVAVADAGGMQEAARRSGVSQPTLSRHVRQLEETLDVALFERGGRGLTLSPEGAGLLARARDVRAAVKAFERQAVGMSAEEAGAVRVTMTELYGELFAPAWLASLRRALPRITVDLVLDDAAVNLLLREAEIAIRLFRPRQLDLVAQRCGEQHVGFFASPEYVAERGAPETAEALRDFDLIGFDRVMDWIDAARSLGFEYTRDDFAFRCDAAVMHYRAARAGLGIAAIPLWVGERLGLTRVLPGQTVGTFPIYLVAHQDLHRSPRVARVWQHLGAALRERFGAAARGDGVRD